MTNIYSKFFWQDLFFDFGVYEKVYFIFSFVFRFFKKKIGYPLNTVKNFGYFLVQIDNIVYSFPVKILDYGFASMRFSSIFWLFFLLTHINFFEKNKSFKCSDSIIFWNFLFYLIVKGFILFGFKSAVVAHGFWPRYLYTPDKLFDVIVSNIKFYKNPCYKLNVTFKNNKKKYVFSNIFKKKKKFYFNTFSFFKSAIYFPVNNLIKLFIFLNKKVYTTFFIRKQKFFNKGRYSRNRQLYRTGVYWCIYVNILAVFGLNYLFYKFTINFLQYWWFFFLILCLFVFPYFFKNSIYSYFNNFISFKEYINFNGTFFNYDFFLAVFYKLNEELNYFLEALADDFF